MPVTHANFVFVPKKTEPRKPMTIPGQVFSIRKVLDRYRRGQSVTTFSSGYEPHLPAGVENLDKIERIELARKMQSEVPRQRQVLRDREDTQRREKEKEASQQQPAGAPPSPTTVPGGGAGSAALGAPGGDSNPK